MIDSAGHLIGVLVTKGKTTFMDLEAFSIRACQNIYERLRTFVKIYPIRGNPLIKKTIGGV
jgi:hypothetical protein